MAKRAIDGTSSVRRQPKKLEHWVVIALYLVIYDLIAANFSYLVALWLRFDCMFTSIPEEYLNAWLRFVPVYSVICLVVFYVLRLYHSIWRFASYNELVHICFASVIVSAAHVVLITVLFVRMPVSYYLVGAMLQFMLVLGVRFSYRLVGLLRKGRDHKAKSMERIMLIGGGAAGRLILRDIINSRTNQQRVCCIIDDNTNKWGRYIDNVPVVGGKESILENVRSYRINRIFLAIPSASAEQKRDILNICKETGCELKILPGMYQLTSGQVSVGEMKDVGVEDLLGREPIVVDMNDIFQQLKGKVIMVTGGGGSIGSELCRQIAAHEPKQLIIFDVYENSAYDIEQELRSKYPKLNLLVLIGSVRDSRKIDRVFKTYHPEIVYHAAAHKHVPLMETSPCEAVKNNAVGTYKTAYAALANGCEKFVLISTDKAVNPTNIMGATKRICEMVIQTFDRMIREGRAHEIPVLFTHVSDNSEDLSRIPADAELKTEFVAVRFGNVLGSNGSVIPLFKKQIAKGGPVTVTHPDIIRYFMTIPEAVSLVLQAGSYAKGGEIFVLDMGAPVKIDTLARNLIKLSGHIPDVDIMVTHTGLRPGEKLYEEKLMAEEGLKKTDNDLIHIGTPIEFDSDKFLTQMVELTFDAYANCSDIREKVQEIVDTYHPAE